MPTLELVNGLAIDEGGFAMIDVSDNGDVTEIVSYFGHC